MLFRRLYDDIIVISWSDGSAEPSSAGFWNDDPHHNIVQPEKRSPAARLSMKLLFEPQDASKFPSTFWKNVRLSYGIAHSVCRVRFHVSPVPWSPLCSGSFPSGAESGCQSSGGGGTADRTRTLPANRKPGGKACEPISSKRFQPHSHCDGQLTWSSSHMRCEGRRQIKVMVPLNFLKLTMKRKYKENTAGRNESKEWRINQSITNKINERVKVEKHTFTVRDVEQVRKGKLTAGWEQTKMTETICGKSCRFRSHLLTWTPGGVPIFSPRIWKK